GHGPRGVGVRAGGVSRSPSACSASASASASSLWRGSPQYLAGLAWTSAAKSPCPAATALRIRAGALQSWRLAMRRSAISAASRSSSSIPYVWPTPAMAWSSSSRPAPTGLFSLRAAASIWLRSAIVDLHGVAVASGAQQGGGVAEPHPDGRSAGPHVGCRVDEGEMERGGGAEPHDCRPGLGPGRSVSGALHHQHAHVGGGVYALLGEFGEPPVDGGVTGGPCGGAALHAPTDPGGAGDVSGVRRAAQGTALGVLETVGAQVPHDGGLRAGPNVLRAGHGCSFPGSGWV